VPVHRRRQARGERARVRRRHGVDRRDRQQRRETDGPAVGAGTPRPDRSGPHVRARRAGRRRDARRPARREDALNHLLSWTLWIPLGGAILLALVPRERGGLIRGWALLVTLGTLGTSLAVLAYFDKSQAGFQMVEHHRWIPAIGASYHI